MELRPLTPGMARPSAALPGVAATTALEDSREEREGLGFGGDQGLRA